MFGGQGFARPQTSSMLGALAVTVLVVIGLQASAAIGYLLALATLVMLVISMSMKSIWPTKAKKENTVVFSLFWGLMLGAIVPFLIDTYLSGGATAVYDIFMTSP